MSFVSASFFVFVFFSVCVYFLVPKKWQNIVLLVESYVFYASFGWKYIGFILFTTVTTYLVGLKVEGINQAYAKLRAEQGKTKEEKAELKRKGVSEKRKVMILALGINFGIWIFIKYINFFIGNVNSITGIFGMERQFELLEIVIPLGISYYTFQAMGYLIDIYRGKYAAERNFVRMALFIGFFPQIVQGPFGRYNLLAPTLFENHEFSWERLAGGLKKILWGYFLKLLVADKLAVAAGEFFSHFDYYNNLQLFTGCLMFSIQLYADFLGYMYIVLGIAKIFGVELDENFRRPYFAQSLDEFWRRWHTSLGTWFRDYMFYPISMSKFVQNMGKKSRAKFGTKAGKMIPNYFALFFVWLSTGLWHGASWKDAIWGLVNCAILIFSLQFEELYGKIKEKLHIKDEMKWWQIFRMVRTFVIVGLLRIISNSSGMRSALIMFKRLLTEWDFSFVPSMENMFPGMSEMNIVVALIGVAVLWIADILREKNKMSLVEEKCPLMFRYCGYALAVCVIVIFGGLGESLGGFMYAQF